MKTKHPIKHKNTGKADFRYSITLEYCGYATPMNVALFFCDKLISSHEKYENAVTACKEHKSEKEQ